MTGISWVAFSENERQRALELARSLQQRESRDELGLGSIRDAVAELLFPGTSTLQTRARYFLFIPWAYEQEAAYPGGELARRVRKSEERLIAALVANCAANEPGLIGRQAGEAVQRTASTLYWQGLQAWGIRRVPGSQSALERLVRRGGRGSGGTDDDGSRLAGSDGSPWHPNLPRRPDDFPHGATFELSADEISFLVGQLRTEPATRDSMLAQLAGDGSDHAGVAEAWRHPQRESLSSRIQKILDQAERFSLLMHGAALLYNVVLARLGQRDKLQEEHEGSFSDWATRARAGSPGLAAWDVSELWALLNGEGASIPPRTQEFVERWLREVQSGDPDALVESPVANRLIEGRERDMKKGNARTLNARALEQWGGYSAIEPLDFRWGVSKGLLADLNAHPVV